VTWDEIGRESFSLPKKSYPLKRKCKRFSKRTSLPNALSKTLGQTLANPLRVHPWNFNCNFLLLKRKFFFFHSSYSKRLIKGPRVS